MRKIIYPKGTRFNRLVFIIEKDKIKTPTTTYRIALWRCDCGNEKIISIQAVKCGMIKSCGCYNSELVSKRNKENSTHKMTNTRLYKIFDGIKYRCNYKNCKSFKYYGGRGIKCLWDSFEDFYKDMNESYKIHCKTFGEKNTSIDRIDNNGDYSKENCRWATNREQQYNKNNTVFVWYNNKKITLLELEKISGIKRDLIYKRINELKWTIQKALKK